MDIIGTIGNLFRSFSSTSIPPASNYGTNTSYTSQATAVANGVQHISDSSLSGSQKGEDLWHLGGQTVANFFLPGLGTLGSYFRPIIEKLGLQKFSFSRGIFKWLGSKLLGGSKTHVEQDRWAALAKAGYPYIPVAAQDSRTKNFVPKGQLIRPDLSPDFVGVDSRSGQWVNNRFSQTRQESDLRPMDIWGYAAWPEKFGTHWMEVSPEIREAVSQKALDLGLVREHHGTIDVQFIPELENYAWQLGLR